MSAVQGGGGGAPRGGVGGGDSLPTPDAARQVELLHGQAQTEDHEER